jgi:ankyrin repeat protein
MLTGRLPFKGDTAHVVMYQIVTADPFEPQPGDAPITPQVQAVLARALSKNPNDRFPDCATFILQLSDAAGVVPPVHQTSTAQIPALPLKPSRSWMALPLFGAFLTLAILGGGIYWYLSWRCCAPPSVHVVESAPKDPPPPVPAPVEAPPVKAASDNKPGAAKKPAPMTAQHETLLSAVRYGKVDVVKTMLAHGQNVNERDSDGTTALMIAAEGTVYLTNNLAMAQMLIDARASLEAKDSRGRTALHRAAAEGRTNVVALLVNSGALTNPKNIDGATPLAYAVEFGKMPVVQLLIAHQAQVDLADVSGTTPLMIASEGTAYLPNNKPMVEVLLTAGARVDTLDTRGRSALYRASAEGKPEIVRVLLDHQAKPNLRAIDGSTPLIAAVTFSRPLVAQILLNHGADANLADTNGSTPLMIAAETSPEIKDPAHFIKLLLEHGAKRGLKDNKGRTALQRATEGKNTVALELLK